MVIIFLSSTFSNPYLACCICVNISDNVLLQGREFWNQTWDIGKDKDREKIPSF